MKPKDRTLYDRIDRVIMSVMRVISYAAVLFIVLIMLMAFFNVIGEKLAKAGLENFHGIKNSNYWIQYWHIPTVFLTIGYVTLDAGHTKIDFVTRKYPRGLQKALGIIGNLIGSAICGFLAWRGWSVLFFEQVKYGSTFNGLSDGFPEWPFGLCYCLGLTLTMIAFLWAVVRVITDHNVTSNCRRQKQEEDKGNDELEAAGVMD